MTDRALQDLVLRALADASFRASSAWRQRALADPAKVERFARFLARHFYYERIVHFFKYSGALARVTGRRPEGTLRGAEFEALLPVVVLGSRQTARAVADLVVREVKGGAPVASIPYRDDLLRYEAAMMVAEAGPRVWRENGKGEEGRGTGVPETAEGTVLLDLAYDLPAVLPQLLQPWTEVPQAPPRPVRLLVARSPRGRVAVARTDSAVARVVELADGRRTLEELARAAGLPRNELEATLAGLTDLGAVRFGTGS
ncbi:MAG: hypothetical protein DMD49_00430 [Gemmatimonadetes bacterium]|nr:MAG: hypothetical protein DMD28_05565 [Gemmatimonadota bacterium]PYP34385.1 MAG: hypothetical protein DMD49_00430 [Gemmatimonadota bacterium]